MVPRGTALIGLPPPSLILDAHTRTHTTLLSFAVGAGSAQHIADARAALTTLIHFCSENHVASIGSGTPIAKHQRLLLDAKVHTLVLHVLSAPFVECQGPGAMHSLKDLSDSDNADLLSVCNYGYNLLRQMVCGNPAFALRLLEAVPFMITQLASCWHAADTLSEMFHNNSRLVQQMPDGLVTCFVRLCIEERSHGGYIKFLCELCVCEGHGILRNQSLICRWLLEEGQDKILPRMKVRDEVVVVHVPEQEFASLRSSERFIQAPFYRRRMMSPDNWVSLSDLWDGGENDPWERMAYYFEQCLALYATLCVGGNTHTREVVSTFVPKDVVLAVLGLNATREDIPDRVESLFWSIVSVLYLQRPLHVSTVLGGHTAAKDASPRGRMAARQPSAHADGDEEGAEFLCAMKAAAMDYLQKNTSQPLSNPDRNRLTKQVIEVWHQILRYSQFSPEELQDVVLVALNLLEPESDTALAMDSSFSYTGSGINVGLKRGGRKEGRQRNVFVRPRSGEPAPSGPPMGPPMRSVEPPVRAGDQAPREPTLGPLRQSAVVRLRPGDPAPSGPPLGPLRRPVERNGGPGKKRNLRQNRGGQNQGRWCGHSAA